MNVLTPVIIVAAIGLVAGIILTIAAKLLYVPVDERVAAVRAVLPGANCGACGFAGCDDYANALGGDPDLSPSLCPVGGADCAKQVAAIMGVVADEADPLAAIVTCTGSHAVTEQIMKADRLHSCKEADMFYGGHWACQHGCLGLGDCVDVCNYDAIHVINGVAKVDREACVGCGMCVKACPNSVIAMAKKKDLVFVMCKSQDKGAATRKICDNGCIGCTKCQKVCKFDAIVIENNLAKIDRNKCKNCGLCAKECPTGAIVNFRKLPGPKAAAATEKEA